MKVVIALGANLGDPAKQIVDATSEIEKIVRVKAISSLYQSEPFKVNEVQPNYTNAVLIGDTDLAPDKLIKELLAIETQLGRVRSGVKAARIIDLDIIDFAGMSIKTDLLTLPHPRAHERRFVLEPWLEIDPEAELSGYGSVAELLETLI